MPRVREVLKVRVTKTDIRNGKPRNRCKCPIALALRRLTGRIYGVGAHIASTKLNTRGELRIYALSEEACQFIDKFDFGQAVSPSTFTLRLEK